MPKQTDALSAYPSGHHPSVLTSHASRTAQNSAAHLLPHLKPGMRILDIGCGPGTITTSFADIVGEKGVIVGIDPSAEVIQSARESNMHTNVTFQVGDGAKLDFEDDSFDVIHAHQVLQHSTQVKAILREMRRVAKKPGGIISLREGDAATISFHPILPILQNDWIAIYLQTASCKGADPYIARKLHVKLREAGFKASEMEITVGSMLYGVNKPEEAKWWGESWAQRVGNPESGFHKTAIEEGIAGKEKLDRTAEGWLEWANSEDAWFAMLNGQAIIKL